VDLGRYIARHRLGTHDRLRSACFASCALVWRKREANCGDAGEG